MNKQGQSIIEYALIAILVVSGIVFMGPYALRSINAHFKLWDDGVQDSFEETINQAPVSVVPNIPLNCKCVTTSTGQCGSSIAGSQCGSNQMIYSHTCPPPSTQGCDGQPASLCENDPSCCTTYYPQNCGTIPTDQTPPAGNCQYGYRLWATPPCSSLPTECRLDSTCAQPSCQGGTPPNSTACPGALSSLTTTLPVNLVGYGDCAGTQKCTYSCDQNYSLCTSACANLQTDNSNCGSCGNVCAGGSTCQSGKCSSASCPAATYGIYNFLGTQIGIVTFPQTPYNAQGQGTCGGLANGVFGACIISGDCSAKGQWTNSQGTLVEYAPNFTEVWTIGGIPPTERGRS